MAGKVGLALGGGGVRGLANIGAMKALLEAGIVPDFVAGTSMGAIVGSLYADSLDIGAVERTIRALLDSKEFREKIQMLSGGSDLDRSFSTRSSTRPRRGTSSTGSCSGNRWCPPGPSSRRWTASCRTSTSRA
jgi:predicted acylesterase/phospholipase RssA